MGRIPAAALLAGLAVLAVSAVSSMETADATHWQSSRDGVTIHEMPLANVTAPNTIEVGFTGVVQVTDGTFSNLKLTNGTVGNIRANIIKVVGDENDHDTSDSKYICQVCTLTFRSEHPVSPYVWGTLYVNNEPGSNFAITVPDGSPDNVGGIASPRNDVTAAAAQAPSVKSASILDNETVEVVFSEPVMVKAGSFFSLVNYATAPTRINIVDNPGTDTDTLRLKYAGHIDPMRITKIWLPDGITDHDGNKLGTASPPNGVVTEGPSSEGYEVRDTRIPKFELATFTSKNTIEFAFSTPVRVLDINAFKLDTAALSSTSFPSKGATIDTLVIDPDSMSGNNTDTIKLKYTLTNGTKSPVRADRDDIPSNLTGSIDIDFGKLQGVYGFDFDPNLLNVLTYLATSCSGYTCSAYVRDAQPPVLVDAGITLAGANGAKQIELTFSEGVRAEREDFSDVRIDGAARAIQSVTPSFSPTDRGTLSPTVTIALAGGGAGIGTDATGTIDIAGTLTDDADDGDSFTDTNIFNAFAGAENQRLADRVPPTVTSARVTALDTVTVEFSEAVNATADTFRSLNITDGTTADDYGDVASNSTSVSRDRTTATITFAPGLVSGEYDATGTVVIGGIGDDSGNELDVTADGDIGNNDRVMDIAAGQRPDITSAEITGPNQFTVAFTEPVNARTGHFTALVIDHNGDSFNNDGSLKTDSSARDDDRVANILSLSGSGTDTAVLAFDGTPASSVAMGYVTISDKMLDTEGTALGLGKTADRSLFSDYASNQLRLGDGQTITVESAWINGPNEAILTFSELPVALTGDFDNLRITGEASDRPITGIDISNTLNTVALAFGGGPAPTGATARIDVLDTVRDLRGDTMAAPAIGYAVTDRQPPEFAGAPAITGPNTVTVTFSEAVTASKGSFALSGGQLAGRTVSTVSGSGTDTLLLGFSGASVPANATGTIAADSKVVDLAIVPNGLADNAARNATDGQPPSIESAGITDSSRITIMFSEPVVADGDGGDFGNLVLNGTDRRTVTDVAGSDTDTLVLTFNGTAPRGVAATVDVAGTISDAVGNTMPAVTGLAVAADQVPTVESATITGPNTVAVTFSEPVTAPKSAFAGLVLSPNDTRNVDACAYGSAPGAAACGTAATYSDTAVLTFSGAAAPAGTTGVINIGASVADEDGNALDALTAYPVAAGQVPVIQYAKFAADDTDTVMLRLSEPVNATKEAFVGLTLSTGGTRNIETCTLSGGNTPDGTGPGNRVTYFDAAGAAVHSDSSGAAVPPAAKTCGNTYTVGTSASKAPVREPSVLLAFDGDGVPQNVTATLGISGMALYDSDGNAMVSVFSQFVAASRQPVPESAGLTGPNAVTMAFSEPVVAAAGDFDNLYITGEIFERIVTGVAGSGTDTVTVAFGGTPVAPGATAVIDVEGITDTAMQEIAPLRSHAVADMQPPTVASAVITAPNTVTVVFSETVTASVSNFTDLKITAPGQAPAARAVVSLNNSTEPVTARTVLAAFDGRPVGAGSSGTMDIAGIADPAGNAMAAADDLPLSVGDIGPGMLRGTVFADSNDNGILDGQESGMAGMAVTMVDVTDAARQFNQTTGSNGTYSFDQIGSGRVLVQVAPVPTGHVPATGTLSYAKATIEPASVTTVDFALYPVPPAQMATVAGKVYADRDADGAFDNGTDSGMPNVPVFAVDFLTLTQASANTTASGDYTITGVLPDALLVQAHPLPARHTTHGDAKSYAYVTPDRGQTVTVDFPLSAVVPSETGTIIIEVFGDANSNGVRDAGESGVEGAVVYTYELLTTTTSVQTTPASGITTHPGLIPDVVLAQINAYVLPSGYTRITTDNAGFEYVTVEPGGTTTVSIGLA